MKILLIASASATALFVAAPTLAQTTGSLAPVTGYGTLGWNNFSGNGDEQNGIEGRLGARFGRYLGVEGDVTGGFDGDHVTAANGDPASVRLRNAYGGYAVGFVPIAPNADLFARVGYGQSSFKLDDHTLNTAYDVTHDSVNYGAGGQYFPNGGPNGIRVDYTRYDYQAKDAGADNVWSLAYVRKF